MDARTEDILKSSLDSDNLGKLQALANPALDSFLVDAIELCKPDSVFVCTDSQEDIDSIRKRAIDNREETVLAMEGHTIHYDGPQDQARDKANTKYLLREGVSLGANINSTDWAQGLEEVRGFLKDSMVGREMLVRFFCLGPTNSEFSISGVQLTDSAYVAHSEDLLYRAGYEQFRSLKGSEDFLRVLHSSGEVDENGCSTNIEKRRVYVDLDDEIVYSVNTQYAGNTVGFKKLSLRLAIRRADREGWLAEHMFVMRAVGPEQRGTYFTGAFPSACGKTSTSMLPQHKIVGDDLAYLRRSGEGVRAVNVECGIFGIIKDVNKNDDPLLCEILHRPGEVIFSNILMSEEGRTYWIGDGQEHPTSGRNHEGEWKLERTENGNDIPGISHKNARYTVRLKGLENVDPAADDPAGVPVSGIIYGGRDGDTCVPVQQALDWAHGVVTMGASLESRTTSATLGQEGVRVIQPMSITDFLSVPIGRYIGNYLEFADGLSQAPTVFGVNYFLERGPEDYLNGKLDKNVWIHWMERRVHGEVEAMETPTGHIPLYEDLKALFKEANDKEYTREDYEEQFTLRIPENLAKLERIMAYYDAERVPDVPAAMVEILKAQRQRLLDAQKEHGDYIKPEAFA